jgi:hypothetical protein
LGSLFRDVDTVQELSVVLISDLAALRNLGAGEGEVLVVDTFEDDLILELGGHLDDASGEHVNLVDFFTTQEVLDFNGLSILGDDNIDGEMSVDESHLVSVTL